MKKYPHISGPSAVQAPVVQGKGQLYSEEAVAPIQARVIKIEVKGWREIDRHERDLKSGF